jgi:hypothetical protein
MEDAMMRQRIHDLLEKKIAMRDMQGGYRRKRRAKGRTGVPPGYIINKKGNLVSYKKHLQGLKLARNYGFRKGSKALKRRGRKRMTGRGFGFDEQDNVYGYGYVPEFYGADGPSNPIAYCYKGRPGPPMENGPYFYNPHTGKCEESLYGPQLARARAKDAKAYAKKIAQLATPLTRDEERLDEAYKEAIAALSKGGPFSYPVPSYEKRKGLSKLTAEDLGELIYDLTTKGEASIRKKKTPVIG